ncbi:hypothetical protein M1N44_03490, partial [Dehalococcoidia bacterium]|nr:hypothetical protein [Dehalococcoidia bacterium]
GAQVLPSYPGTLVSCFLISALVKSQHSSPKFWSLAHLSLKDSPSRPGRVGHELLKVLPVIPGINHPASN